MTPMPCPFCGSNRVIVRFYNQPSVVCEECLAMGPATARRLEKGSDKDEFAREAVQLWNRRQPGATQSNT